MSRTRVCFLALACAVFAVACDSELASSTLDSGLTTLADGPALRLNVEGDAEVYACGAGFTQAQVRENQVDAVTGAPKRCQGSSGSYLCECDGEPKDSYAFGCVAALFEACGVVAELVDGSGERTEPPAMCSASGGELEGDCERTADGYSCSCASGGSTDVGAGEGETHGSCEQALFAACAPSCSDDFGACAPSEGGVLGEYDCSCATNGFRHVALAGTCDAALLWACNPLNQAEEVCTGYGGSCLATSSDQTELSCTCVDRTSQTVEHIPDSVEPRFRACRETLEATCGVGAPPEGAQCIAEANGAHARCTRGPEPDATMTCECYADDGSFDTRIEELDEHTCDMATLAATCPELAN
jgi:hypothetical protein